MQFQDIPKWVGIIVLAIGSISAYAVNNKQIETNTNDIDELQDNDEQRIRMEERQKGMQEDLKENKKLLQQLLRQVQE